MKSITGILVLLLFLTSCSSDTEQVGTLTSGETEPYLITIKNGSKKADLLLWFESDYLKYNEISDIIEVYKDTAEVAYRWSDEIYDGGSPWDTVQFVMKDKNEVYNFQISK